MTMAFKPWERLFTDIRLVPKMVILMVFSTVLIVAKQLWDAHTFYTALLSATHDTTLAQQHYDAYLTQAAWQTLLMIVVFVVVLLFAARIMLLQTRYISSAIKRMANHDLSVPVMMECKDEYGDVARELETTRQQLQEVIQLQLNSSKELSEMSEIMTISMTETKASAQEEFHEIDQLATAMSEMSSTVHTVADYAQNASQLTETTSEKAQSGQKILHNMVSNVKALSDNITSSANDVSKVEESVAAIGSMVGTIQGISGQTNLLALNAAIEAARAGEAGRGFAVVADEVRHLAQRTQEATIEIQEMITQLQADAGSAVESMEKSVVEVALGVEFVQGVGTELDGVVAQVEQINEMNFQIATAAGQQNSVAEEMNKNISNVRELVEASVMVVGELLETSESMQSNAEELDRKMKMFNV